MVREIDPFDPVAQGPDLPFLRGDALVEEGEEEIGVLFRGLLTDDDVLVVVRVLHPRQKHKIEIHVRIRFGDAVELFRLHRDARFL